MNSFGSQKKPTGPLIVGLTGQTGAGKSTVTEAFAEKGFVVIDCDALTRELQTRPEVLSMLSQAYGPLAKEPTFSGPEAGNVRLPRTSDPHHADRSHLLGMAALSIAHPKESEVTAL